ncbi:MAG: tetratricopeptide repeat protein, partial [bacterium]
GLFAAVAAALLTGPDISSVGRALAQFPGSSLSQPQTAQPSAPVAASRRATVKKAPSDRAAAPGTPSSGGPAPAPSPARAPSRPPNAAPRPSGAEQAQPSSGAPAEVPRIQHFYGLMDSGIALYNDGWYGPALARFRRAASVMPGSPYAHLWWGRAAVAAGRPDEAREPLERAVALARGGEVARKALLLLQQLNGPP